jgi:hypothetical protein
LIAASFNLFSTFFSQIEEFDNILVILDFAILDIFYPGLAGEIKNLAFADSEYGSFFHRLMYYRGSENDMPASLKHIIENSPSGSYHNFSIEDLDKEIIGKYYDESGKEFFGEEQTGARDYKVLIPEESLVRIDNLCKLLKQCKESVATLFKENWSFKEIMDNKVNSKIEITMGDKFENVKNSTIINRSVLEDSFNTVKNKMDEETANVLIKISEIIEKAKNTDAAELYNSFNDELKKTEPKKSLLRTIWNGILAALPLLGTTAGIAENISKIISG